MSDNTLAFFTGLFGSIHCLGMCGPLAFSVPSAHAGSWMLVFDKLIYQLGRVVSYTLLGVLTGFIGKQLWMAGLQQVVSIVSGLLIVTAACSLLLKWTGPKHSLTFPFTRLLSLALKHRYNHLVIGMLNGMLPCGFVSLALAGAINTGTVAGAAVYMTCFGAGTMPLMLVATLGAGWITPLFRKKINKVVPWFMLCLGAWFVLRGLTLSVPYLVPGKEAAKPGVAVCR
ncbi:sulfite exporter TauE/SafE family protein [Hufsiella ginkgonis]|uniref:Sulfite exporter TauE/SafE family protein n=1 Tax=Hufsiella ginkgonis TaxID=2695274 RepID=A0A7K1Y0J1_9SPHI|nr:sulfite exporter TauE/SafE family protein [Hufsiella ginkgonis]MXV16743.1 sulfite exporter TauE/SafE family protein [Hufsiella ginkgonis]